MASRHSRDLTRGSVFKNLVLFAVPILLSNMLQQLYHAADVVVVGNFSADTTVSLAAKNPFRMLKKANAINIIYQIFLSKSRRNRE